MSFGVRYSASAQADLTRLYDYLLARATTVEDLDLAEQALGTIVAAVASALTCALATWLWPR